MLLSNVPLYIYLTTPRTQNHHLEKPRRKEYDLITCDSHISNTLEDHELFKE